MNITLDCFWSYKKLFDEVQPQAGQLVYNILLFILFGGLLTIVTKGKLKKKIIATIIVSCLLSGMIELFQLVLKLGFAEFDDVMNNTLGTIVGLMIVQGLNEIVKRRIKRES